MRSKNVLFLLIAVYFLFTFPLLITQWNLNMTIGWAPVERVGHTYLLPLWFILIFLTYKRLSKKGIVIPNSFFWIHVLLTIIPTFYFNYPFVTYNLVAKDSVEKTFEAISRIRVAVLLYYVSQILLYGFLIFKLLFAKSAMEKVH